jgi:hypothetical protein
MFFILCLLYISSVLLILALNYIIRNLLLFFYSLSLIWSRRISWCFLFTSLEIKIGKIHWCRFFFNLHGLNNLSNLISKYLPIYHSFFSLIKLFLLSPSFRGINNWPFLSFILFICQLWVYHHVLLFNLIS